MSRSRCLWLFVAAVSVAWPLKPLAAAVAQAQRRPGPPLQVRTLDGKLLKIELMKGKVVLVDFMTTVCPACKLASAGIQRVYQELGSKGFCPVAVALNADTPAVLKEYAQEHNLTFALGTTARADVTGYLNHPPDRPLMVPTLVLLDRRGRICSIGTGWMGDDTLRASILRLLDE